MQVLSDRINRLQPSATLAMSQKSAELKAQGVDVINLSVGEPDFPTPPYIRQAAARAMEEGYTTYSPVAGYADLREAICAKLLRENGLTYTPAEISVANGAKQSVCNAVMALVERPDEEVIIT
ncbi:MAG: aminotransferase class I/II-fold pyridoxal phosphate-dependent enzyme, partial [Alloprevotella sp.]|nr:aminotransferase class I/II-fold pyridoxal phosphate-dependent enzyme [Alloprevotella sp.]